MQHAQQQSTWPLHELGRACRCMPRRERDSRLCGAVCAVCHLSQVSMLPCPQPTEPRHPCISAPFHAFRLSIVKVSIINPPRRSNFKGSSCEEQGPWNMSLTCRRREPTALSSIAASTSCFGQLTIMVLMLRYSPLQRPASCTVERAAFRPCSICLTRPTPAAAITTTLRSPSSVQLL